MGADRIDLNELARFAGYRDEEHYLRENIHRGVVWCAQHMGVSQSAIERRRARYNIPKNPPGWLQAKQSRALKVLQAMPDLEEMSIPQLAERTGYSKDHLWKLIRKHGLKVKSLLNPPIYPQIEHLNIEEMTTPELSRALHYRHNTEQISRALRQHGRSWKKTVGRPPGREKCNSSTS